MFHDLEKRPIISENVKVSTQERTVRYKPTRSHLSFVLDLVSEFFSWERTLALIPPPPLPTIYVDNISTSPVPFAFSFTFTAEHILPCIMESYVSGAAFTPHYKPEAEIGLSLDLCHNCELLQSILWLILIISKPTTFFSLKHYYVQVRGHSWIQQECTRRQALWHFSGIPSISHGAWGRTRPQKLNHWVNGLCLAHCSFPGRRKKAINMILIQIIDERLGGKPKRPSLVSYRRKEFLSLVQNLKSVSLSYLPPN